MSRWLTRARIVRGPEAHEVAVLNLRSDDDESRFLVARTVRAWRRQHGGLPGVHRRLRTNLGEAAVIYLTALIAVLLFVYLGTALVRPEWF
jgi:F subunit of K+-transporting ATPase (Potass_KdpF)